MIVEPLAICRDYRSLADALKARRLALGFSQLETDDRAGLQDGYVGKLEAWDKDSGRRLGPVSLGLVLQVLGLEIALVETHCPRPAPEPDPAQLALPLVGGAVRRWTDQDFKRLPGRNRRRAAREQAAMAVQTQQHDCIEMTAEAAE